RALTRTSQRKSSPIAALAGQGGRRCGNPLVGRAPTQLRETDARRGHLSVRFVYYLRLFSLLSGGLANEIQHGFALRGGPDVASSVCVRGGPEQGSQRIQLGRIHGAGYDLRDRKSTRLNSSHVKISYA